MTDLEHPCIHASAMRAPWTRAAACLVLAAAGALASACSSSSASPEETQTKEGGATAAPDASAADAGLSGAESDAFQTSGDSFAVDQQVNVLANELFDFDPTIVPADTAAQNAAAIARNIQANLGTSCGKVTVSGDGVTVAFGAPPGCTLADGTVVSGTVDLTVSKAGGATTIALTLDEVVVNGQGMSGTASFVTSNGSTFAVTTDLTYGAKTAVADLTVTGASGSFTVSGTDTTTESGASSTITLKGVTVAKGQCYADAGSMTIAKQGTSETITFTAETPSTGKVTLTIGKLVTTSTLPAYGSCPTDEGTSDGGSRSSSRDAGGTRSPTRDAGGHRGSG